MTSPDFSKMTTDDLVQIIPANETNEWEFKAASIFDKANFSAFKKQKLGKIVSSFANSGGGFLLLGRRDGTDVFDDVPTHEGRTSMEDHLAMVISQAVTPNYRNFKIFRVPIAGAAGSSVLVVAFLDSVSAPHQSVADVNYFYRLPGHSVPAPHFYLEVLRTRYTKALIAIEKQAFDVEVPFFEDSAEVPLQLRKGVNLIITATFVVKNASLQIADPCAMRVFGNEADLTAWKIGGKPLGEGLLIEMSPTHLYPTASTTVNARLCTWIPDSEWPIPDLKGEEINPNDFLDVLAWNEVALTDVAPTWEALRFNVQLLTQNFASEIIEVFPARLCGDKSGAMLEQALQTRKEKREEWMREQKEMEDTLKQAEATVRDMNLSELYPKRPRR